MALICLGKQQCSCSLGAGEGSRGEEETDTPLPVCFIWLFLFFKETCVPLRLSHCVLLVVALRQKYSLCSVASCWWWFCSFWQWTAQHLPRSHLSLESKNHKSHFFPGKELVLKNQPEGLFFFFFKLLVLSILFPQLEQNYCFLMVEYQKDTEGLAMKQGGT